MICEKIEQNKTTLYSIKDFNFDKNFTKYNDDQNDI